MTSPTCSFWIKELALKIHLGWPEQERQALQTVMTDIEIRLPEPPRACLTDQLDDTFCYADLIQALRKHVSKQPYKLIEHLGCDMYQFIKPRFSAQTSIVVHITKHPPIEALDGGICFRYGDD